MNSFVKGFAAAGAAALLLQNGETANLAKMLEQKRVLAWGSGQFGILGIGRNSGKVNIPTEVPELRNQNIQDLCVGRNNVLCVLDDGTLLSWGSSEFVTIWVTQGMLGFSMRHGTGNQTIPTLVEKMIGVDFKQVSIGNSHCAAVTKDGKLYTWGSIDHGKLGHHTETIGEKKLVREYFQRSATHNYVSEPTMVVGISGVTMVACGPQYTTVLNDQGEVFVIGTSKQGGLGLGDQIKEAFNFQKIKIPARIKAIKTGGDFTFALDDTGRLYSWGNNKFGQLGDRADICRSTPNLVTKLIRNPITSISCGETYMAAIDDTGALFTWGDGSFGQLGHGSHSDQPTPQRILFNKKIVSVGCGESHTGMVTNDGEVYMFGYGYNGQMGRGDQIESTGGTRTSPVRVEYLTKNNIKAKQIWVGGGCSFIQGEQL